MQTTSMIQPAVKKAYLKPIERSRLVERIGPMIAPSPKAPVLIALILFLTLAF